MRSTFCAGTSRPNSPAISRSGRSKNKSEIGNFRTEKVNEKRESKPDSLKLRRNSGRRRRRKEYAADLFSYTDPYTRATPRMISCTRVSFRERLTWYSAFPARPPLLLADAPALPKPPSPVWPLREREVGPRSAALENNVAKFNRLTRVGNSCCRYKI